MINLRKEKILITGANGFLGKHLMSILENKNIKFYASSSKKYDLTMPKQALALFKKIKPTIVFSLAAKVGGILANKKYKADFYKVNSLINTYTFEMCKKFKVKKLINVGAGCGYPLKLKEPLKEEEIWDGFPQIESAPYSLTKKMILMQSVAYKEQYNLNSITLIPSNLYGEYDNFNLEESHVIPALVRKFYEAKNFGKKLQVWGNSKVSRDFIHANDVAKALILAAENYNNTLPLNICQGEQSQIGEIVKMLKEISGYKSKIIWQKNKPTGQRSRNMSQVNQKKFLSKWKAKIKIYQGLEQTYKWFSKNYKSKKIRI